MIDAYKNFFKNYCRVHWAFNALRLLVGLVRKLYPFYSFWIIYFYTVFLSAVMDSVSDSASEATFMVLGLVVIIYAIFLPSNLSTDFSFISSPFA